MPWPCREQHRSVRQWAALCCGLTVLMLGSHSAASAKERTSLGSLHGTLPSTTVVVALVPVEDALRESLSAVLNPEQKPDELIGRLATLSVERTGLNLLKAKEAALFVAEGGERGLILLGDFGSRALKHTDRRLSGLPAISVGGESFLVQINDLVVIAPKGAVALLARVARGEHHKLLGTERLVAFRAGQSELPRDGMRVFAHGSWLVRALTPQAPATTARGLKVAYGTYLDGRAVVRAVGSLEAISHVGALVDEALKVLKLQRAMLIETGPKETDFASRVGQAVLVQLLTGLIESFTVEGGGGPSEAQMVVRFSLPRILNSRFISLFAALSAGKELDLLDVVTEAATR